MPLRLGISRRLVQFTSNSISKKIEPTIIEDVVGLLLQNNSGLILTENEQFIVRQEADKNVLITQSGDVLVTQSLLADIGLNQSYLYADGRDLLVTENDTSLIL